ncbi:unnamed protein product [Caenorhabditis nigoni]
MLLLGLLAIVAPLALGAPACFDEVNRLKEAYAYKFNIASMNKVQYMEHLERSIDYGLERNGECPEPTFSLLDEAYFLNARENTTIFEDMVIGFNYRYMACKVTYCPRTAKEIVSYAAQIVTIQHNRKLNGPPASKCHETWPVPKGGLCAGAEEMTQRERQQWRENAIIYFLKKTEQGIQLKQERSKSNYGRKSMFPFECPPGANHHDFPGCHQSRKEPTTIFEKWVQTVGDGEKSPYSIMKKLERERKAKEQAERNARDYMEYLNRKQEEEMRSESKYGRKSAVPLKCFPGETEKTMPGCYQEKPVEYKPIDWEDVQKTMDKFVDSLIAKKGKN